jgi:hypothetical protein
MSILYAQNLTIKQNNHISTIQAEDTGYGYVIEKTFSYTKSFTGNQLIIKVRDITPEFIDELESQYDIKNTKVLSTGEFIYKVNNPTDIFIICEDLATNSNIITVKPIINTSIKMH